MKEQNRVIWARKLSLQKSDVSYVLIQEGLAMGCPKCQDLFTFMLVFHIQTVKGKTIFKIKYSNFNYIHFCIYDQNIGKSTNHIVIHIIQILDGKESNIDYIGFQSPV